MTEVVLAARGLTRAFREGAGSLAVLTGVDLSVTVGERVAIVGSSGSGKTTLLQLLGGLDRPDAGGVEVAGQDIHALTERARCELRNRQLGFVYQFHHLLPEFSALENVAMPLLVRRMKAVEAQRQARAVLERVGLSARGSRIVRTSFQVVSGNGPPWRAHWSRVRDWCWPMNPPAISTAPMPSRVFELMLELNRERGTSLIVGYT